MVEQISCASIKTQSLPRSIRRQQIDGFIGQVDALQGVSEEKLVSEMRALMKQAKQCSQTAALVGDGKADAVIRVDEVLGIGGEVEYGKDAAL